MVKVDESCILRYKKEGETIEALVDFKLLLDYIHNKDSNVNIYDIYADTQLFADSKKGLVASDDVISKLFKGLDEEAILEKLAKEGEPQIPTAYLNEQREKKKEQIIEYLAAHTINPQSGGKYTTSMIKSEFDTLKISIDPNQDHIHQAEEALKQLRVKMPIKIDSKVLIMQVEAQYSGNFYGKFRTFGTIQKEFYDDNGNLHIHIEIGAGRLDEVEDYIKVNSKNTASYHVQKEE